MQNIMPTHWQRYLREFLLGAITPSLPALIGALSIALIITTATLLLFLKFLTPDFMAKNGYYFMEDKKDDFAYLTTKTLQISKTPAATTPLSVVLIGKSNGREGLDSKYLEQVLLQETQTPITVYKLMIGGLTLWEEICVLDNISDKLWGVVVLQVQPFNLAFGREHLPADMIRHSRLALYCPSFDEEMQRAGITPYQWKNEYFVDHHQFFIARLPFLFFNLIRGPRQWAEYTEWQQDSDADYFPLQGVINRLNLTQRNYPKNHTENMNVYHRLVERLRQNSRVRVAFLEALVNPKIESLALSASTPEVRAFYQQYNTDITNFSQTINVPYWNLRTESKVESSDFIDYSHLKKNSARHRYTHALAIQLTHLLTELKEIKVPHP